MASDGDLERAAAMISKLNLSETVARDTLKNAKITRNLIDLMEASGLTDGCDKATGDLVYMVAIKFPGNAVKHRPLVMQYIKDSKLKSNDQVAEAMDFFKTVGEHDFDVAEFDRAAGVGVTVSAEDISAAVAAVFREHEAALREERYHFNVVKLLSQIKKRDGMRWADIRALNDEMAKQQAAMLGPKTALDEQPRAKAKKAKAPKEKPAAAAAEVHAAAEPEAVADPFAFLPEPKDNHSVHTEVYWSDGRILRISNTKEQLQGHLARTGGKVVTRFPPEPNGYLHIGHAKAMFIDFGMAERSGGVCYLRFDDTNPEAEKQEYIDHIQEIVTWMGWRPCKVTFSSDYFAELHACAVQLIREGLAYVCHQSGDEIKASREQRAGSPWRDRPVEESLRLFDDMRRGLVDEGAATLRLKMDPQNDNFTMFDLIAYRIKFVAHPHAGPAWCIYPSYDFTHCIVDSLEDVTHSLCTLEFESRRASYYWLLDALRVYKPVVWEYSRLNITHNVMSKRKLQVLVNEGHVRGWDDPRMMTLAGLRRRGVTPEAINSLCREIGITRNENEIHLHKMDHHVRNHLNETSRRALAVLRPLKLVISNLPDSFYEEKLALDFPGRTDAGYSVPFTNVVYIEATDFREQEEKDYYGLAPGKSIMLRYAYVVHYKSHKTNADGVVTEVEVEAELEKSKGKPPKGVLNWVARPKPGVEPPTFEARLYSELFKSQSPAELEEWLADLNPDSEAVLKGCYMTEHLSSSKPGDRYQFERVGYFCCDPDSKPGALVFNRTTTLRDSYVKPK